MLKTIRAQRRAEGNTTPLYLHTDACQAANYLDLHVSRLGVDMMTLNGGKIYVPKQSGVLYVASHVQLQPIILGGGQERVLRSGTENVAGCVGFAAALDQTQHMRHDEVKRLNEVKNSAIHLLSAKIPGAIVNGSLEHRLPNNLHVTLPGFDNERVLVQLEQHGILAAAGSACSASNDEPGHVLRAMGLSDENAQSSLRFTFGRATTLADVEKLVQVLTDITKST